MCPVPLSPVLCPCCRRVLIAPSSLLLCICVCYFNTTYWVCFCCLCIYDFLLTTLHWTTKKVAHSWKRLTILSAVISACWSVFRGDPPPKISPLHIHISIDIVIVLLLFTQPFLRVDSDFLVFGLLQSLHPLAQSSLNRRHRNCDVKGSVGPGSPWSARLCLVSGCAFLCWSPCAVKRFLWWGWW